MAFNQQPINYAQQYAKELANAYPYLSYFGEVWASPNNASYRPISGKTIMVPSMEVSGARAVNRDSINGQFTRNFNLEYEPKEMSMYREWDTIVDPMDIVETNDVATIANVTRTFNEFQKIPEMDAYAASKLAKFAGDFGGIDSTSLDASNILANWDAYLAYMADQRVNRDRLTVHVTPATYKLLKEAAGITRFIDAGTGIRNIDRNVGGLDGVRIVETPSDMMKTLYDFTSGWAIDANANTINMLFVDPMALIAPVVYDVAMFTPPSAATKGKNVYYESYYYDVFNLRQRQAGFFANVTAPSLGALTVTSVAGTAASGDTVISVSGAQFMNGKLPYGVKCYYTTGNSAAVSCTYNAALPNGATWVEGIPALLKSQTSGKHCTVALVNAQTNKVIAAGDATIVAKA